MLIAARALLGVAGATLAPSTLSLIRNMFHDGQQRTVAISRLDHELLRRRRHRAAPRRPRPASTSRGAPSSCSTFR